MPSDPGFECSMDQRFTSRRQGGGCPKVARFCAASWRKVQWVTVTHLAFYLLHSPNTPNRALHASATRDRIKPPDAFDASACPADPVPVATSKWFTRSTSASRIGGLSSVGDDSPRPSTSSINGGPRKPKISRPTDPRPILDAEGYKGVPGSRSVLDLTRPSLTLVSSNAKSSLDLRSPPSPSSPRPLATGPPPSTYGNGDLRNASRRPWSKSADDLRMASSTIKASASVGSGVLHTSRAHTDQSASPGGRSNSGGPSRQRADSLGPAPSAATTGSFTGTPLSQPPLSFTNIPPEMPVPFYARKRTDSERSGRSTTGDGGSPGSTLPSARAGIGAMVWPAIGTRDPTREGEGGSPATVSVSVSAPLLDGAIHGFSAASGAGLEGVNGLNGGLSHSHTRSHSFTPKLSSRLVGITAASPGRKGSAGELEIPNDKSEVRDGKDKEKRSLFHFGATFYDYPSLTDNRVGTSPSKSAPSDVGSGHLAPPHIILEPASEEPPAKRNTLLAPDLTSNDGKRASQIVYAAGFINRLVSPALDDPRSWKPFKMEVRGLKDCGWRGRTNERHRRRGSMDGKRRAEEAGLWGRGRHPALGVASANTFGLNGVFNTGPNHVTQTQGKINKGTMEALIHELVFATGFMPDGLSLELVLEREEEWRKFSLAVLLLSGLWTHSRSEIITVWARVGELCRAAGDECSWRVIAAALCSAPVARLDKDGNGVGMSTEILGNAATEDV
ncbi:hypothetical protein C8F01DRAFT_1276849 [Mycena amicta]|nr:hypothetical protein C8F01DRAFT_1276849 [Mycena amicta]